MSDEAPISKTQRKKAVHALQALGEELVELNDEQLAAIELPEALRDAVMAARRITKFEAQAPPAPVHRQAHAQRRGGADPRRARC